MTFEEWVSREGGYLNDSDPEAKTARRIALRAWHAALASAPAWHDAPTCDGLWVCSEGDDNPYRWTTHRVKFPISPLLVGEDERWYGPIPQDGGKS